MSAADRMTQPEGWHPTPKEQRSKDERRLHRLGFAPAEPPPQTSKEEDRPTSP